MDKKVPIFDDPEGSIYTLMDDKRYDPKKVIEEGKKEIDKIETDTMDLIERASFERIVDEIQSSLESTKTQELNVPKLNQTASTQTPSASKKKITKEMYEKLKKLSIGNNIVKADVKRTENILPKVKKYVILALAGLIVFSYSDDILSNHNARKNAGTEDTYTFATEQQFVYNITTPDEMAGFDSDYIVKKQIVSLLKNDELDINQRNSIVNQMIIEYMGIAAERYLHTLDGTYSNSDKERNKYKDYENDDMTGWLQMYYSTIRNDVTPICTLELPENVFDYLANNGLKANKYSYNNLTNKLKITERKKEAGKFGMINSLIEYSKYFTRQDHKDKETDQVFLDNFGDAEIEKEYEVDPITDEKVPHYVVIGKLGQKFEITIENNNLVLNVVNEETKGVR